MRCTDCGARMYYIRHEMRDAVKLPDTSVLEARAGGLDKAAEICRYHAGLPMRNEASKAMARDIETSCLATAGRIRRGEYENPTSDVMQTEGDSHG